MQMYHLLRSKCLHSCLHINWNPYSTFDTYYSNACKYTIYEETFYLIFIEIKFTSYKLTMQTSWDEYECWKMTVNDTISYQPTTRGIQQDCYTGTIKQTAANPNTKTHR